MVSLVSPISNYDQGVQQAKSNPLYPEYKSSGKHGLQPLSSGIHLAINSQPVTFADKMVKAAGMLANIISSDATVDLPDLVSQDAALQQPDQTQQQGQGQAGYKTANIGMGGGQGRVSAQWLYQSLRGQGIPPVAAAALVAIAGRESGYRSDAYNGNRGTGDDSLGLFQINLLDGGWTSTLQKNGMSDPRNQLLTPEGSVMGAAILYNTSGLTPWGGYKGVPWQNGTDLAAAAAASGGEVSVDELANYHG